MLRVDGDQRDHADERQQAPGQRVEEERHRRPPPLRAAVDPDQEEERDQRELEEDVEEHHVEAGEEPEQARLEGEQEGVMRRGPLLDRLPRREDRRDHQERRQHEQPEARPVEPEREPDAQPLHPLDAVAARPPTRRRTAGPFVSGTNPASRTRLSASVASTTPSATDRAVPAGEPGDISRKPAPGQREEHGQEQQARHRRESFARGRGPVRGCSTNRIDEQQAGDAQGRRRGVELDQPVLDRRQDVSAERPRHPRRQPDEVVDDHDVEELRRAREELRRPDHDPVVDLVDVELVERRQIERPELRREPAAGSGSGRP